MNKNTGPIEREILKRIQEDFAPLYLELANESYMHNVPKGSESHFRLFIVSQKFSGLERIVRHRLVNQTLSDLLKSGGVHALTQRTLSPDEWQQSQDSRNFVSPPCLGGNEPDPKSE